ncbi:FAD binding domain-containing protein [Truncatella angustata]|uniref:FAD binding domain-containing protein n=1 Tax=Truncatella angustata TaxID=152316 RepID=A0A9P8ZZC9_9PEZI|nr:FAD binding domain-containing protein [Truncatella angustata]KAH6656062.1 FAD binding domain-containing protein [Truncatella angustata]
MQCKIIIVGAGIAGLSAAIALRKSCHIVEIYERSSFKNELGAAITIGPNAGRLLKLWGVDPAAARFVTSDAIRFWSYDKLEEQSFVDETHAEERFGAPLWYAHRVDLHDALRAIATQQDGLGTPVVIHLGKPVVKYHPEDASVTLADGEVVTGDAVIAADGVHSGAVEAVLGHPNRVMPANSLNFIYRFLLTRSDIKPQSPASFFLRDGFEKSCTVFSDGLKRRLVYYPCRNAEVMNFGALCYDNNLDPDASQEDWHAPVDKSTMFKHFEGYHPTLLGTMNECTDLKGWPLLYRAPVTKWHRGNLTLTGDAAHPMLPLQGQAGCQAMEDAMALGLAFHGVRRSSQIPERLKTYESIRRNRASLIQVLSDRGTEQGIPDDVLKYLEGQPVPSKSILFGTGGFQRFSARTDICQC